MLCLLLMTSLLVAALGQPALATTAEDMLFGNDAQTAFVDNNAIYGSTDGVATPAQTSYTTADLGLETGTQYPMLSLGDSDADDGMSYIVFLQNRLIELGYLRDTADGTYGANTEIAVKQFQKNNGLPATGIADSATQNRIYQDDSTLVRASLSASMFGSDTTRVQSMLAQWGFLESAVDGTYGDSTARAVRVFKNYVSAIDPFYGLSAAAAAAQPTVTPEPEDVMGMPVVEDELLTLDDGVTGDIDGDIDEALMRYINGEKPFAIYRYTVQKGDTGDEVWRVQRRLRSLNYLYKPDGAYGNLTKYALMYFQRKCGLKQTGIADEKTQRALFSANPPQAEEYVFPYKIWVDISDQRVYVAKWTGKDYSKLVQKFKCSTGKVGTPTPLGHYQADGKANGKEWYYMQDSNVYVKWATRIVGGVMFHSVIYSSSKKGPTRSSVHALGHRASHGCIRLTVKSAKWIFDNCPAGTTVIIRR